MASSKTLFITRVFCTRFIAPPRRTILAGSPCRSYGTRSAERSSRTNPPKSFACFNSAFGDVGANSVDFYPEDLRPEIDALNARVYATLNNGVYRAGFATTQAAYEEAVGPLFATLDFLEERLADRRYLCGDRVTEADIRLLTTLLRFDIVYVGTF